MKRIIQIVLLSIVLSSCSSNPTQQDYDLIQKSVVNDTTITTTTIITYDGYDYIVSEDRRVINYYESDVPFDFKKIISVAGLLMILIFLLILILNYVN